MTERRRITKQIYVERGFYELAPLQQVEAEARIKPAARANYIDVATMSRCIQIWLAASALPDAPVIGWVHPVKGPQLFEEGKQ